MMRFLDITLSSSVVSATGVVWIYDDDPRINGSRFKTVLEIEETASHGQA